MIDRMPIRRGAIGIVAVFLAAFSGSAAPATYVALNSNFITVIARAPNQDIYAGTIKGVFRMPRGATEAAGDYGAMLQPVNAIAAGSTAVAAGTSEGFYFLEAGLARKIYLPRSTSIAGIDAIVESNGIFFAGGPGGLHQVIDATATPVELPHGMTSISALDVRDRRILVAGQGAVYEMTTNASREDNRGPWRELSAGISYERAVWIDATYWVGLRSDGSIDLYNREQSNAPLNIVMPGGSAASAIAAPPDGARFYAATYSGRIFEISIVAPREIAVVEITSRAPPYTVTSLLASENLVYAGLEHGGLKVYENSGEAWSEREWFVSETAFLKEPGAGEYHAPDTPEVEQRPRSLVEKLFGKLRESYAAAALTVVVLAGLLFSLLRLATSRSRDSVTVVERRRAGPRQTPLPALSELSPPIRAKAEKFRQLTEEINEITRHVAHGRGADVAERAQGAATEFRALESDMRADLEGIAARRAELQNSLRLLRGKIKSSTPGTGDKEALAALEAQLEELQANETYLRYVLES